MFKLQTLNERTDGLIFAWQLKDQIERILRKSIGKTTISYYRHKVIGTNYRRCKSQPKIFTEIEKLNRYLFATNLLRSIETEQTTIQKIVSIDECKIKTYISRLYHNRLPSSRPKCSTTSDHAYKALNVWSGTSYYEAIPVVVIFDYSNFLKKYKGLF